MAEFTYRALPLTNDPRQRFNVRLSIDGENRQFICVCRFNDIAEYWILDIYDGSSNPLIVGVPLLPGDPPAINLLESHAYKRIGSMFVVSTAPSSMDRPIDDTLEDDFEVIWGDTIGPLQGHVS